MKTIISICFFCILSLCSLITQVSAEEEDQAADFFTLTFENDYFVNSDDGFTSGLGLTFGSGPHQQFSNDNLYDWQHWLTKNLYISTMANKTRAVENMFFQRIQTPTDLEQTELIEDDLPYAAVLAWQGSMYAWDENVSDQFSLTLGAVGPIALGEEAQDLIHNLTDSIEPKGWDNQIDNEAVVKVEAQRTWNLYRSPSAPHQFEVLGLASVGLGNLKSAANGGLAIRWGKSLASSFSTFNLNVDRQLNPLPISNESSYYVFAGVRAGYVFNDIFIDGNTFSDSPSVPLENTQYEFSGGLVFKFRRYGFVFQLVSRSSPTSISDESQDYGALGITYKF